MFQGEIDVDEMVEIFCLMYALQVIHKQIDIFCQVISSSLVQGYTEEEATERAMKIFATLDKNGDGSLAEDEFIKVTWHLDQMQSIGYITLFCTQGCLADNDLLELLNAGPGGE